MRSLEETQALTQRIKDTALTLGFDRVGIIDAGQSMAPSDSHLQNWLAQGFQADMAWMVTHYDKRIEPASLMDNTRFIVCVAMNYYTPDPYDKNDSQALKIAKYARGTDYHYVLKDRLKLLLKTIQEWHPEIQGRALTDSAPIMEKPLAVRAGLGWQGKNGNVISPGLGSFIFLGELLLDVPLIADVAEPYEHCGSCRRCIEACPTDAIVQNSVIDANRCISYWTIESKAETIPASIQENLQGWIFGCDICQDVCPWNLKFARPTVEPELQPRPWNHAPDAIALLALDEDTFRINYRRSPIKRTKMGGFKRNIRAALGQAEDTIP